jgi:hypothetical protein
VSCFVKSSISVENMKLSRGAVRRSLINSIEASLKINQSVNLHLIRETPEF